MWLGPQCQGVWGGEGMGTGQGGLCLLPHHILGVFFLPSSSLPSPFLLEASRVCDA